MLGCGAMARAFAARIAVRLMLFWTLPGAAAPATQGVTNEPCPPGAVVVEPKASIQAAVDRADEGAAFCLKNGVHRLQVIRPRRGQRFHATSPKYVRCSRCDEAKATCSVLRSIGLQPFSLRSSCHNRQ